MYYYSTIITKATLVVKCWVWIGMYSTYGMMTKDNKLINWFLIVLRSHMIICAWWMRQWTYVCYWSLMIWDSCFLRVLLLIYTLLYEFEICTYSIKDYEMICFFSNTWEFNLMPCSICFLFDSCIKWRLDIVVDSTWKVLIRYLV